jgi:predicted TIM-barrel fold metal-dependent hydrolase
MIIDVHTHTGNGKIGSHIRQLELDLKKNRIGKAVVFPTRQDSQKDLLTENLKNSAYKSEFFFPFFRFDPKTTGLDELRKLSAAFCGFKFHPRAENFDVFDKKIKNTFEFIETTGKPVIIHSRKENNKYSDPDRLIGIAKLYPGINFIFAHFANDSDVFFEKITEYENAYVETSIVSSPMIIERRADTIGADRILFGSDTPYSDAEIELMKVTKSKLTTPQKDKILYRNALKLLESHV